MKKSRQSGTASLLIICCLLTLGSFLLLFSSWSTLTTPVTHPHASEEGALLWNLSWRISQTQEVLFPYAEEDASESSWSDTLVLRSPSGQVNILSRDSINSSNLCVRTSHSKTGAQEYRSRKFLKEIPCTPLSTLPITSFQVQGHRSGTDQHINQVQVEISYQGESRIQNRSGIFSVFSPDSKWVAGL